MHDIRENGFLGWFMHSEELTHRRKRLQTFDLIL